MKKNRISIFHTICFLLFMWLIGAPVVSATENIDYREIVTNISTVETESNVISSVFGQGQLTQNDIYIPKQNISGGFVSAQFSFVYLYTEIIFNNETSSEIAQDENFRLSNYVATEKLNTIDEIIFYYAPGGMVTQSFVLKGTEQRIQDDQIHYGRFASTFVENDGVTRTFAPKKIPSPPSEIDEFTLVQSDYPSHFVNDSMLITYEYEPSTTDTGTTSASTTDTSTTGTNTTDTSTTGTNTTDTSTTGTNTTDTSTTGTNTTDTSTTGTNTTDTNTTGTNTTDTSTIGSDRPSTVFSSNDNDTTKKNLPQTGESNNQLFIPLGSLLILGILTILYYRKKRV